MKELFVLLDAETGDFAVDASYGSRKIRAYGKESTAKGAAQLIEHGACFGRKPRPVKVARFVLVEEVSG